VTYLGLENVEEVWIYRKDGAGLTLRDAVVRAGDGQTEYVGRFDAVSADLGAEFGVLVKTTIPVLEFEIENDSVRTLEESDLDWTVTASLPSPLVPGVGEALDVFVTAPSTGDDVAGAHVTLSVAGGSANPTSGDRCEWDLRQHDRRDRRSLRSHCDDRSSERTGRRRMRVPQRHGGRRRLRL
jgi:hypothetical protein